MIRTLQVDGFKGLAGTSVEFNPAGPTVLLGPNGSGKSTILQAVETLWQLASRPLDRTRLSGADVARFAHRADAGRRIEFGCVVDRGSDPAAHTTWTIGIRKGMVADETLDDRWKRGGAGPGDFRMSAQTISACFQASSWTDHSQPPPAWYHVALDVANAVGPVRVARFNPGRIAEPARAQAPVAEDGFGLPAALLDLQNSRRKAFLDIDERFRTLFPWIEEVQVPLRGTDPKDGASLVALQFLEKGAKASYGAAEASSGMLLGLALLWTTMRPEPDRILCFDEPENSMHPYLLREVYDFLAKASRGELGGPPVQVIVATQSVDFVNLCTPEEVRVCERDENGVVRIRSIHDRENLDEALRAYEGALGELWYSGAIGGIPRTTKSAGPG